MINENEGENFFFRALRGMIGSTRLYLAAFGSVTALFYQPPHPWGASDGPELVPVVLLVLLVPSIAM